MSLMYGRGIGPSMVTRTLRWTVMNHQSIMPRRVAIHVTHDTMGSHWDLLESRFPLVKNIRHSRDVGRAQIRGFLAALQ